MQLQEHKKIYVSDDEIFSSQSVKNGKPSPELFIKIADAYGIDAKDLLFEDLEVKFKDKKLVYKISH